ncbi:MAG: cytochrome c [Phycisphaerae bacterium]|nr:MAG: cytochrome c [Phycisphaerae bacterium]
MTSSRNNLDSAPDVESAPADERRLLRLCNNLITLFGLLLIGVAICLLLTFALFTIVSPTHNPYVDIIGYMVLPGILLAGLIICPIGVLWTKLRQRVGSRKVAMSLRTAGIFLGISFFVVLPLLGVSGYHGYHYTESTEFCANACHSVMAPQATTYEFSPHARVSCAECHIGSGATPLVKSKLSGLRQVYAVTMETYSRPIPPAITELRPARDTCESCHWPEKFFGDQLKTNVYFSQDEKNTRYDLRMVLKTGGADASLGLMEGIHLHMLQHIEFVAIDENLQHIPWVRYLDESGQEFIYRSDGRPATEPPPEGIRRKMDCMDCHNRGAHKFRSPQESVNILLRAGHIDASLPYIKREAVSALSGSFTDRSQALTAISNDLLHFYQEEHPEVWREAEEKVTQAVEAVKREYQRNFFPEMKVNWKTYPSNIGHLDSPGCLRCHDGQHVNQNAEAISSDCNVCHTFLNEDETGLREGEFDHPMKIHERWRGLGPHRNMRCDQCHTGGPLPRCAECHATGEWLKQRGMHEFDETAPTVSD